MFNPANGLDRFKSFEEAASKTTVFALTPSGWKPPA
jgi:hypothetical protein